MTTIIVPALNEEARMPDLLNAIDAVIGEKEVIVVDGRSADKTADVAHSRGAFVISSERGRGAQLHAGALSARGDVLWFLHADATPSASALIHIETALRDPAVAGGNFQLIFDGRSLAARQMTWIYPRLRFIGLSYGDAGIFVRRSVYERIGGFRPYPIFEDLDLIRRLKREGRFVHLDCCVFTSSRRFERGNYIRAWAIWIALQVLYWMGVSPYKLARWYRHAR